MAATIGLMEGAYFVGRRDIMDFINNTLDLRLAKVEDTASGCVACQLLDMMFPNVVPMSKVNWSANKDFEYVANYKILQTGFTKLNIDRHIDVDRLITGKYMDNLEFMQWFKRYFELTVSDVSGYDCIGQRSKGKGGAAMACGASKKSSVPIAVRAAKPQPPTAPAAAVVKKTPTVTTAPPQAPLPPAHDNHSSRAHSETEAKMEALIAENEKLKAAEEEGQNSLNDLRHEMDGLERERDFYFDKLRDIEVIFQEIEDKGETSETTTAVFKILYATQDGFEQTPADDA
jgi:microtubule-associated protein, RP/EB family